MSKLRSVLMIGFTLTASVGCKFEAIVQDGYISGATVCSDSNSNGACDGGESSSKSKGGGKVSLKGSAEDDTLIAEVGTDAIDSDTGTNVKRPFTLAAPAGFNSVINPLTTLVYARMQADAVSAEEAEADVIAELGVEDVLDYDYIAAGDTEAHEMAVAIADKLADAQELIADSQTENIGVKAMIAVAQSTTIMLKAGKSVADVVLDKGQIYAVSVPFDDNNPRNAASYDGEVEVLASSGYHSTLFDSADNKCQHCHNDLYDTWQESMHSQSWVDPIFQAKYQDFLRLHISKIGAVGPTGEYTEETFKKVSQVCVKCHAPGAFYSGDYNVELESISDDPLADFDDAVADNETNLSPAFDPASVTKVVGVSKAGTVYSASYHIGNKHNREGINCSFCHSIETVRLMNDVDSADMGSYTLANSLKMGPIGPVVREGGETLTYSADGSNSDMNAFFALIGPDRYADPGDTPKQQAEFDNLDGNHPKGHDGRYVMKSVPEGEFTGGPFYGPYGVTGTSNSREDDDLDRVQMLKQSFVDAGQKQHFGDYGKGLCMSCHQRSSLLLNPEVNGVEGVQVGEDDFMEICTTWTAMSDGIGDNYTDTLEAPKCQKCHMEQIANKTVLHKWNDPESLFTAADGVHTPEFDPDNPDSLVALNTMNNHAFMGANVADFGLDKIKSGFSADMSAKLKDKLVQVETKLLNKTAHMFPGAHPMRRVLTRVVVTDADGNLLNFSTAQGNVGFESITNTIATLPGEDVQPGREEVQVVYDENRNISFQGKVPDLDGGAVASQMFDLTEVVWSSPDSTVSNAAPVLLDDGSWAMQGTTTAKKILDSPETAHFTRIYGRETGAKTSEGVYVVRPGFDSNIVADNRLVPNEYETYEVSFDASSVTSWPVKVTFKVYYMKKGASGNFPVGQDGFLDADLTDETKAKLAVFEVFTKAITLE